MTVMKRVPWFDDRGDYDEHGIYRRRAEVSGMHSPVRCQCGGVYDIGTVTVTARHLDCSVWTTPCCGRQEDDRPWVRRYVELDQNGRERRQS